MVMFMNDGVVKVNVMVFRMFSVWWLLFFMFWVVFVGGCSVNSKMLSNSNYCGLLLKF